MAEEGEKREGGEGPNEETEFAEYVEYLKKKYPEGGIKDDESAGRPHEKESAQREESAEGSSKRARGNHTEQPEENEVKEDGAGRLEANNEGGRDEEFERLWERIKERLESHAAEEKHDLDQEGRNPGSGPVEERAQYDVKEEPKTLGERLSRESEAPEQPESGSPHTGIGENRTDRVGEGESRRDIRQGLKEYAEPSMETSTAVDRNKSSNETEHKIETSDNEGPTEGRGRAGTGHPYHGENVVSSREVAHANQDLRPTSETPQGRIDSNPTLTAAKLEHEASKAADGGGHQREADKERIGIVDSALSEDSKALRKLQSDGALPDKILGNEGFYRKEIVDLDKVTEPGRGGKDTRFLEGDTARSESDNRPYVRYAHKGPFEVGDSIPVKANLTGVPPVIRLDVLKSHIESVTGVEIDRNKLYEINGSVEGAYDFDIYRTVGKYVYLLPSLEQRDKVQPGRVYDVSIKSVAEVPLTDAQREILGGPKKRGAWRSTMYKINHAMGEGDRGRATTDEGKESQTKQPESIVSEKIENINATWILAARLHEWNGPRRQFNINGSEFERKTGVTVEEMRDYVVRGRIDGVGEFQKTLHRCAAGQHIPIYVPAKLQDKVEPGRSYRITIDSIQKLPPRKNPWEGREAEGIHWTWREVASWVDTEGWIGSNPKRGGYYDVCVCQKERKMLEGLGSFLESEGFHSRMTLNRNDGVYHLHVHGADQAARVIKNIEPFIRTVRKKEEIANFKESIARPRRTLWPTVRIARKILGLTEN